MIEKIQRATASSPQGARGLVRGVIACALQNLAFMLPTGLLYPDNEAKVQAAFAQLAKGKTVIMIAHRLSTVANADKIYVVQNGQIAESGTKDALCAQNGVFAKMWQDYQSSVEWKVAKEG